MEEELRCFHCDSFYHVPVLLTCYHALCLSCAHALRKPISTCSEQITDSSSGSPTSGGSEEVDKVSVLSDADSGVSCCSRPTSLVGAPEGSLGSGNGGTSSTTADSHAPQQAPISPPPAFDIKCPRCEAHTTVDARGAEGLPRFRVLSTVIDKHLERFQVVESCQLCDDDDSSAPPAEVFCDQCMIFYCSSCKDTCHPSRGPLADHWLVSVTEGRALLRARRREREGKCTHHPSEGVSMYCLTCRLPVCLMCLHDGHHHTHDVQSLNAISKTWKTELSQSLHQLSERAKAATELIHDLKTVTDGVHDNWREVEGVLVAKIDALVDALQARKTQLISWGREQRDTKVRILREQTQEYTQTLQSTTGAIHFFIEALKEADPIAFTEAQEALKKRIEGAKTSFMEAMVPKPRVSPAFNLSLGDKSLHAAINSLTFLQLKPPDAPSFLTSECSAENNSVTVSWTPQEQSAANGFLLEIDDGLNGLFTEVYRGCETVCTIDGLHFDSLYRARVRAFNSTGVSPFSELLRLQTAQVAWFAMASSHPDIIISEEGSVVSCDSYEHRVVLGSVGFSRGSHYWQFVMKKYDGNADVAFGVSKNGVELEKILGRCENGWSMYIDGERSWFMRSGDHFNRSDGGVRTGDVIGLFLSCTTRILSFYVNHSLKGTMILNGGSGVLYPAVSLNRSTTLTLQAGLPIPEYIEEDGTQN